MAYMPKWMRTIRSWFGHCRELSVRWWAVTAIVWSVFCGADTAIAHFGSDAVRADWKALTFHVPLDWQTWLIGFLFIGLVFVYDGSYRHTKRIELEKADLIWSADRPILLFDSWGEVPHDHPEARFHEVSEYRKEREYFERGFFLTNQGGTAHEIYLMPVPLTENVYVLGRTTARIDKGSKGFVFAYMDTEHNAKFGEDFERWDLPKVMAVLEKKINTARVEEHPLAAEIGVVYRDIRGVWFASTAKMIYRNDLNRIVFSSTEQYPKPLAVEKLPALLTRP
jgi:hypothetical protein